MLSKHGDRHAFVSDGMMPGFTTSALNTFTTASPDRGLDWLSPHRRVADGSPIPTAVGERPGYLLRYANPAFVELFDCSPTAMTGESLHRLLGEAVIDPLLERVEYQQATVIEANVSIAAARGRTFRGLAVASPIRDGASQARGLQVQLIDTSRYGAANQDDVARDLRAANERLLMAGLRERDLADEANRAAAALRESESLREQYLTLISHDLRGPLTAAKLTAQLLAADVQGTDTPRRAARIVRNLELMERMVHDLLDAHRIRAGEPLLIKPDICDLVSVAREVIEILVAQHGDRFLLRAPESLIGLWSARELHRAIWNLATNAVQHGSATDPITVALARLADGAELTVHNQGAPIPEDELPRLFDPFASGKRRESGRGGGWGLGLTLVRGCAQAHGGRVEVRSDARGGTTFRLTLPLSASSEDPPRT
jgi:signal transduction histidine kinase